MKNVAELLLANALCNRSQMMPYEQLNRTLQVLPDMPENAPPAPRVDVKLDHSGLWLTSVVQSADPIAYASQRPSDGSAWQTVPACTPSLGRPVGHRR